VSASARPERLVGHETAISVAASRNVTLRTTWFDNRIKDLVSNVTISQTRATSHSSVRISAARGVGIQNDVEYRAGASSKFAAAYVYDQAKVTGNRANTALIGKHLPQVTASRQLRRTPSGSSACRTCSTPNTSAHCRPRSGAPPRDRSDPAPASLIGGRFDSASESRSVGGYRRLSSAI
jgi:hypothetical protein